VAKLGVLRGRKKWNFLGGIASHRERAKKGAECAYREVEKASGWRE